MRKQIRWAALGLLLCGGVAVAAEPGFYVTASGSRVEHEMSGRPGLLAFETVFLPGGGVPTIPLIPPPQGGFWGYLSPAIGGVALLTPSNVAIDDTDVGFGATLGYRINRYLAAEVAYEDFGESTIVEDYLFPAMLGRPQPSATTRYSVKARGPSVSVLGSVPISERWEIFLRAGVLFADREVQVRTEFRNVAVGIDHPVNRDYSDEVGMAGLGVQWSFASRWSTRLEYQRVAHFDYDGLGESKIEQASLSVTFNL